MGHGLEVEPLGDGIGVAIHGLDLSRPMDADTFAAVRDAFLDRKVMVVPDQQGLDVADLVRFARGFGRLKPHILDQYHHPDTHEVSILTNRGDSGKGRDTARPPGAYGIRTNPTAPIRRTRPCSIRWKSPTPAATRSTPTWRGRGRPWIRGFRRASRA